MVEHLTLNSAPDTSLLTVPVFLCLSVIDGTGTAIYYLQPHTQAIGLE